MRKLFPLASLLVLLFGACQKDGDVGPAGPLYQTWRLVQTQVGKRAPQVIDSAERIIIEFQPGGRILYDHNGRDGACCVPRRFEKKDQILFVNSSADQPEYCNYVDLLCASQYAFTSPEWIVVHIDTNQLVLQIGDRLLTHQPYP
ncbi:hypothetical protein [Spirosoma arcticum]